MKLVPGVGFEPTLAYVHISVKQMTLNLSVLKLQTLSALMSHDLVHYLTWAGRFFYSHGVSEDGSYLGAQLGGNLQDGPAAQLAEDLTVGWCQLDLLTRALAFPFIRPLHVVWVPPSTAAIPRGRKQERPDLLGPGLRSYRMSLSQCPVIQSRHRASLSPWVKDISSASQREGNIHVRTKRIDV